MASAGGPPGGDDAADKKPIESTHYAWAEEMKRRGEELKRLGVDSTPQALDDPSVAATAGSDSDLSRAQSKGSAWNTGGTWEDRDTSEWLKEALPAKILASRTEVSVGSRAARLGFTAVDTCEGTASLVFVRGKAKPGFEMKVKASFTLSATDDESVTLGTGTVEGLEMCDYDGFDFELGLKATADSGGAATTADCKRAAAAAKAMLTEALRAAVAEMAEI